MILVKVQPFALLEVTERTASAANIFNTNEEEEDRWCPGEPVSLYDVDNVLKGNYKHMAMVETLPWKGRGARERVARVANERED